MKAVKMNKMHNNTSGFSLVVALLILVVLSAVGTMGWYVWNKQSTKKTDSSNTSTDSTTSQDSQNNNQNSDKYVTIKEWNVRAPYSGDAGFQYKIEDNEKRYAMFTSTKIASLGHGCDKDSSIGSISRYKTGEIFAYDAVDDGTALPVEEFAKQDSNLIKAGEYYYYYGSPHMTCAIENGVIHEETAKAQGSASNELKTLVSKLEEVK